MTNVVDPDVPPSGSGCVECTESGAWWLHLRRCAACGHIGCCDNSPGQHTTAHANMSGHPVIRSFEPGEEWFMKSPPVVHFMLQTNRKSVQKK